MASSLNSGDDPTSRRKLAQIPSVVNQKSAKALGLIRIIHRDVPNDFFYI